MIYSSRSLAFLEASTVLGEDVAEHLKLNSGIVPAEGGRIWYTASGTLTYRQLGFHESF